MNAAVGSQSGAFNVISAGSGSIGRLYADGLSVGGVDVKTDIIELKTQVASLLTLVSALDTFPDGALLSWNAATKTLTPVEGEVSEEAAAPVTTDETV